MKRIINILMLVLLIAGTASAQRKRVPALPAEPNTIVWDANTGSLLIGPNNPGSLETAFSALPWEKQEEIMTNCVSLTAFGEFDLKKPYPDADWYEARDMEVVRRIINESTNTFRTLDLSRITKGLSTFLECTFRPWDESSTCQVEVLKLPDHVQYIRYGNLEYLNNLQAIHVAAIAPPAVEYDGELLTKSSVFEATLYVPANSVESYVQDQFWGNFTKILPIGTDVQTQQVLTINIQNPYLYEGKKIYFTLTDANGGTTEQYVVVNAQDIQYRINVPSYTMVDIQLRTSNGGVIAEKNDVAVEQGNVSVSFDSYRHVAQASAHVINFYDEEITDQCSFTWSDQQGNTIGDTPTLAEVLDGDVLTCTATLPAPLANLYEPLQPMTVTATPNGAVVYFTPQAISFDFYSCTVIDALTKKPIPYARMTAVQKVTDEYSINIATEAESNGFISKQLFSNLPTTLTFSADGYEDRTINYDVMPEMPRMGNIELSRLNCPSVEIKTTTYKAVVAGTSAVKEENTPDFSTLIFDVRNETKGKDVDGIQPQNGILYFTSGADQGDALTIKATSTDNTVVPVYLGGTYYVVGNNGPVEISFRELGGISLHLTEQDNDNIISLLFDKDGNQVGSTTYSANNTAEFLTLAAGTYTIYTIAQNRYVSGGSNLDLLNENEYVKNQVEVSDGIITNIEIANVPTIDFSRFNLLDAETRLQLSRQELVVGNSLTVNSYVVFDEESIKSIADALGLTPKAEEMLSDIRISVTLPGGVHYIDNSALYGTTFLTPSVDRQTITFTPSKYNKLLRFSTTTTVDGQMTISANISFKIGNQSFNLPIGSANFTVSTLKLSVPNITHQAEIKVRGTAKPEMTVRIYEEGVYLGETQANGNGNWLTTINLINPHDGSLHYIHAYAGDDYLPTNTDVCKYIEGGAQPDEVNMVHFNEWMHRDQGVTWNFPDGTPETDYYYFYQTAEFGFNVSINGQVANGENVTLTVECSNGTSKDIELDYNASTNKWTGNATFDWNNCPTGVSVNIPQEHDGHKYTDNWASEIVRPIHDPQGFVYEGVLSNRLEGVTATIYEQGVDTPWDAAHFGQVNPQTTDVIGMYQWDVPAGQWQVRFTKPGYEPTQTEWLPVPPPQLDINIPMVQNVPATVDKVDVHEDGVDITFSKYMNPADLTSANISIVSGGNLVQGTITLVDADQDADGNTFARQIHFTPNGTLAGQVSVVVAKDVTTYAGIKMTAEYNQSYNVVADVTSISVPEVVYVEKGQTAKFKVVGEPVAAAAGKTLLVSLASAVSEASQTSVTFNANGEATVEVSGLMIGSTVADLVVDGCTAKGEALIKVRKTDDIPTGIEIKEVSNVSAPAVFYNLQGMRINKPQVGQIYIHNGHKMVRR